ncbi:MAG: hypothetical protein GF333_08035 [Candidatus Omnitrophica bacterium]|nr:hypothetical protein [Candidatus Omnitrophota bacterium]
MNIVKRTLKPAQMILMYAALIAFVVIALIVVSSFMQEKVQGIYKQAGDGIGGGEQLDR